MGSIIAEKMVSTFMVRSSLFESRELLVASSDSMISLLFSRIFQRRMFVPMRSWKYIVSPSGMKGLCFWKMDSMMERWGLSVRRKLRISRFTTEISKTISFSLPLNTLSSMASRLRAIWSRRGKHEFMSRSRM